MAFGLDPSDYHTMHSMVWHQLAALQDAGLVEFQNVRGDSWGPPRIHGPIRVVAAWEKIQQTLGISLAELSNQNAENDLLVRPVFERPKESAKNYDMFVLMPFADSLRAVYDDHIKPVAAQLKVSVGRADDFFTAHAVIDDVWSGIFFAKAIVADCTGRNPNVFYEIGLAHVLGKPVVLITQNVKDIPFDVRHIRFIKYTFTPRGMVDFEKSLAETLQGILPLD